MLFPDLAVYQQVRAPRKLPHDAGHLSVRAHSVDEREAGDLRFLGQPESKTPKGWEINIDMSRLLAQPA